MKHVTIPAQWLQELIALCGPEDHELRERVMKSAAPAPADALAISAQPYASGQEGDRVIFHFDDADQARAFYRATQTLQFGAIEPQARDAEITWPKARDVGRIGDMSQVAHIRVGFDSDNDVFVSVWDENGGGSIEFCNPGGGGGGQSSRTRMALIALMVAMEADNAEKPSRDWWSQHAAIAAAKGE